MMSKWSRNWIIAAVWVGTLLRFQGLFYNNLSSDEALYASYARLIATWQNPLLAGQLVDKPPLLFYLEALFYPMFGAVEWAARMPNFLASIILIPLVGLLAWKLYSNEFISMFAAAFVALSPLAIRFSGTAYTDPLLTFFVCLSVILASRHANQSKNSKSESINGFLMGLFFGLATATKYQAWLFVPFTVGIGKLNDHKRKFWMSALGGMLLVQAIILIWVILHANEITLINRQWNAFGGLRTSWSWELWRRFDFWATGWSTLFDSPIINIILLLGMPVFLGFIIFRMDRFTSITQWLLVNVLSYSVLHWLLAIPAWDRYLLPILPLVAILVASFIYGSLDFLQTSLLPGIGNKRIYQLVLFLPLLFLLFQGKQLSKSYQGVYPHASQQSLNSGAREVAEYLEDAPYGTVLYDHWFSWLWRYHLFDHKVYVSWFSGPDRLVEDLDIFKTNQVRTYIVVPDGVEAYPILRTLEEAKYKLSEVELGVQEPNRSTMYLYEISKDQD